MNNTADAMSRTKITKKNMKMLPVRKHHRSLENQTNIN